MDAGALARRAGMSLDDVLVVCAPLVKGGTLMAVGQAFFSASVVDALQGRLLSAVAEHHRSSPMAEGLPREEARERVFGHAPPALFEDVLRRLSAAGKLTGRDRLAQPGRGVSLTPDEARAYEGLARVFESAGLAPPDLAGAASAAGVPLAVADRVSKLLVREKTLVRIDTLLFHAAALERLKQEVRALKGEGAPASVDVAGFKERYGVSRKYAIPLLEWLDRERVTRRAGDARVVL
jgi:selenocysteine-specific elongation factor